MEEIAVEDKVTVEVVKNSIKTVEFKQGYHTNEYLQQNLIGLVLRLAPAAQVALHEALAAATTRETTNDRGERVVIKEPDHDTRLKAVSEFQKIAVAAQPKPGHTTNLKVGVGVGVGVGGGQASGTYVGMEDRMRELRQKMKDQPVLAETVIQTASLKTTDAEIDEEDNSEDDEQSDS